MTQETDTNQLDSIQVNDQEIMTQDNQQNMSNTITTAQKNTKKIKIKSPVTPKAEQVESEQQSSVNEPIVPPAGWTLAKNTFGITNIDDIEYIKYVENVEIYNGQIVIRFMPFTGFFAFLTKIKSFTTLDAFVNVEFTRDNVKFESGTFVFPQTVFSNFEYTSSNYFTMYLKINMFEFKC